MNIWAWMEPTYYDGLWTFYKLFVRVDEATPLKSWSVTWGGQTLRPAEER